MSAGRPPPRPQPDGHAPTPLDAVAAVLLDGLSYRRAGRMVGISKTEVGDSMDRLLDVLATLGYCQPDGTFTTTLADLRELLQELALAGEALVVDGLATRVQRPSGWNNQKVWYDAKRHAHTAQGLAVSTVWGDLLWCDGGWPGSCHEHELVQLSGLGEVLDASGVASLLDRGFRGMAKRREHWHAPVGDRRTNDRLSEAQRTYNRCQAGLRALVEQSIGHLANGWSLRRWRGRFYRLRAVFRAAGALICLGRWLHRVPVRRSMANTLNEIAMHVFARPGHLVVCEEHAHTGEHEAAAAALLSGVAFRRLRSKHRGLLTADQVAVALSPDNPFDAMKERGLRSL